MSSYATAAATAARGRRHGRLNYRPLGGSGLQVSPAGFGGYRVDIQNSTHRAALEAALAGGINLLDTSANYADGGSERLVGAVLSEQIERDLLERQEIIVVTKGGYLQGENFALSQQRQAANRPWPDLVPYASGLEHCIHPDFLADQIGRSLARLQLATIDFYLLHNPEYYLGWAKKIDLPLEEARQEYDRRIRLAFTHLEEEVNAGRIRAYGISSNAFPKAAGSYDFTSLEKAVQLAESITPQHHFQMIQLPFNLLETEAATEPNQSTGEDVLALAERLGLAVLANRPLNAVVGNNLIRLAGLPPLLRRPDEDEVLGLIEELIEQEQRLQQTMFASDIPFRTKQEFAATTAAGRLLRERWHGFGTFSNWRDVRDGYLFPRTGFAIDFARRRPELPPAAAGWIDAYEQIVAETLAAITAVYQAEERARIELIQANAAAADPAWVGDRLSQTAVRAPAATTGISTVLVGMRRPDYVADVLASLENPPPPAPRRQSWHLLRQSIALE